MSQKISVQQRKYFVERIENSINDKIDNLKQANASKIEQISDTEFDNYLKGLGVFEDMARLKDIDAEVKGLKSKLDAILSELKDVLKNNNYNYDHRCPSTSYGSTEYNDFEGAYRWCCRKTAHGQETITEAGKMIKQLEDTKRAAIDELHGVNELEGLKATVNNILKGADVPLLGE